MLFPFAFISPLIYLSLAEFDFSPNFLVFFIGLRHPAICFSFVLHPSVTCLFIFIQFYLFIGSCVSTPERPFSPVFDLSETFSGHLFM